jgi:hypothetical protein
MEKMMSESLSNKCHFLKNLLKLPKLSVVLLSQDARTKTEVLSRKILLPILLIMFLSLGGCIRGLLVILNNIQTTIVISIEKKKNYQFELVDNLLNRYLNHFICGIYSGNSNNRLLQNLLLEIGLCRADLSFVFGEYQSWPSIMRSSFRTLSKINERSTVVTDTFDTEYKYKSKRNSFICPCNGRITSHFGKRTDPVYEGTAIHYGIDIAGPMGSSIHCVLDGTVLFAGEKARWGNVIIIDHNYAGYKTIYAHLHKITVKEGDMLLTGQIIGYRGNTGKSTGPHLHYEVRQFGKAINPLPYLLPQDAIVD